MKIILVHGFLDRGHVMRSLARHLEGAGHRCLVPTLRPNDGRGGLAALAMKLQVFIGSSLAEGERFVLIGFSMGAVISRYYLQELSGHQRVAAFFSIAGPHQGTFTAYLYPSQGVREMRPGSKFLRRLEETKNLISGLPTVCYWTPYDLMVRPLSTTRLPGAEHVCIPALAHPLLLVDRRLHRDIAERLKAFPVEEGTHVEPRHEPSARQII